MSLPTDNIPERLYYPVQEAELQQVLQEGILPHGRTMVHLSRAYWDAYEAGTHQETPAPLVLRIDSESAQDNGIIIQRAGKTVFTVEEIPPEFVSVADDSDIDKDDPRARTASEEEPSPAGSSDVDEIVSEIYSAEENGNGDGGETEEPAPLND